MVVSMAANRTGAIREGSTTLSSPMTFGASDIINTSETITISITNVQKYMQHQVFTVDLTDVTGSPSVAITAYGRVTSTGSWVQIGSPITWTSNSNDGSISSTTPANYNYLKVEFVASGATQQVKIAAFTVKTANVFDVTSAGLVSMTSGATINGGIVNVNASSNNATNIGTGSTNAAITIGGGSNNVSVNSSVWDITAAGVVTGLTGITTTGNSIMGNLIRKHAPVAVNATATASAATMLSGVVTSTSASATGITTPTATAIAALIPGCGQGTAFDLIIDNSAGSSTVTLILDGSITIVATPIITGSGTLTLATGTTGKFSFYFTSATAARCFRVY
jgi:hypothetical protein